MYLSIAPDHTHLDAQGNWKENIGLGLTFGGFALVLLPLARGLQPQNYLTFISGILAILSSMGISGVNLRTKEFLDYGVPALMGTSVVSSALITQGLNASSMKYMTLIPPTRAAVFISFSVVSFGYLLWQESRVYIARLERSGISSPSESYQFETIAFIWGCIDRFFNPGHQYIK